MTNLPEEALDELQRKAREVAGNSYSPYSKFRVGAALLLTDARVVTGTNVENTSYGLTICAERAALFRAVAESGPEVRIAAVAVVNLNGMASPPCGACRQVLAEFMDADGVVSFPALEDGEVATAVMRIGDLLPHGFDLKLK